MLPAALVEETAGRLRESVARHAPAAFTSSFGAEDMVVLELVARHAPDVEIVTLDTGRLHDETYTLIERARERYRLPIRVLSPDAATLEGFVTVHGVNAFYRSVELRERCCAIRKTEPLARALAGKALWITGLRRAQSAARTGVEILAADSARGLMKLNPLADWTDADVWDYVKRFDVPVNPLHARGFPSIGCAPCTRAVQPGEDARAGRWWWEAGGTRECGLHVAADGRLVRGAAPAVAVRTIAADHASDTAPRAEPAVRDIATTATWSAR